MKLNVNDAQVQICHLDCDKMFSLNARPFVRPSCELSLMSNTVFPRVSTQNSQEPVLNYVNR